jgi:hypothetical protein
VDQSGIRFSRFGIAYTNPFNDSIKESISAADGFSIEIALKPASLYKHRFRFILSFHNGADSDQLVMAQYLSQIILMNGDDYAHTRKSKRITVNADSAFPKARFVTITTGKEGTRVYVDGQPVRTKKDLRLKIPKDEKVRLLLGNSVYGKHGWRGDVYGLALYNYSLSSQDAGLHFNRWSNDRDFSFVANSKPTLLYLFDENGGTRALDHAGSGHHLEIPSRFQIFKRSILAPPWKEFGFTRGYVLDVIVNLVGFIPFGFVLVALLNRLGGIYAKRAVLITVALCFILSLSIEIIQSWIPSRSSHTLDLTLNTFGSWLGTYAYRFFSNELQKKRRFEAGV